ncbi:taste receptor type 2 member 114-like [Astyanax mexicanus]|uniref:Taste receptor type 2 n=1 Tax=Astyanax mexicanus TaxID=7994 RepID=A0A8T2LPM9_ASTMX|nr:taste receptor type 2 member 114-like [Astyanax mexicanus]
MSSLAFASVNVPLSAVSIILNLYFIFCMAFPEQGSERMKQPLKVLLGSLFGFNTALHACSLLWALKDFLFFTVTPFAIVFTYVVLDLVLFSVRASVTSSLWLNVFYYCQIVPAQRPVFIWVKKNIKSFIYFSLIVDKIYILLGLILNVTDTAVYFSTFFKYIEIVNYTNVNPLEMFATSIILSNIVIINFWIRFGLNLVNFCVMSAASCATVLYLWKHIKSMKDGSSTISSPHLKKQMRVTITGIAQAVLYFLCAIWTSLDALFRIKLPIVFDMDRHILCTVICFYSFGTTINVCVGQTMLRQRVVHLQKKILLFLNLKK